MEVSRLPPQPPGRHLRALRVAVGRASAALHSIAGRFGRLPAPARVAALAAIGTALAVAPILGPSLFFAIPWPVRKSFGRIAFLALFALGARRIALLKPADDPPPADPPPARGVDRLWPFVLFACCASLAVPMLRHPADNFGFGDWDLFLGKLEAARRTIVDYGQFPWWDPWTRGGFPLAANPQCGVVGVAMPLAIAFGTTVGMRLATIVCFALAAEGARRLARLWLVDPLASAMAGLIFAINGAVLVAAVAAYHVSMCYAALPWMLYYTFRLDRRPADGVGLGFWSAFNVLNGIQYFTVYIVLIVGVAWLRALRVRAGRSRGRFLIHTALAIGVFLGLAGWRVATTAAVYRDFPRERASAMDEGPLEVLSYLLGRPSADLLRVTTAPHDWETTCYVGPIVLALAIVSVRRGWRWWHTLAAVCGVLAIGSVAWYHPSYWLSQWPVFSTMHAVTRWRFMALLGVAIAASQTIAAWRSSGSTLRRRLALAASALIAADYLAYGFAILPVAFEVVPTPADFPGPPLPPGRIVQVREAHGFPAYSRGYGVIHGYEPLIGYDRKAPTARLWRGHPDYHGESWTADGVPVEPVDWTPNRIEWRVVPGQVVFINQNPGSWWRVNGRRPYSGDRCAETRLEFAATADAEGRLVVEIAPPVLALGYGLHAAGLATAIAAWLASRRLGRLAATA